MDGSALAPFRRAVDELGLGVSGVHVQVRDRRPLQWHAGGVDVPRNVHSVGKTLTAMAIGIAIDEAKLDVDRPALSYLPELAAAASVGSDLITVRHLLTMTAGKDYRWLDDEPDQPADHAVAFFAAPLLDEPGAVFRYRGTNTYLLGRILARIYGLDLLDLLDARMFGPLGIPKPQWTRCPLGYPLAADGLYLRTGEIGRIAQVLLADGVAGGHRILSVDTVRAMTSDPVVPLHHRDDPESSVGYGWQIWQCTRPDTWRMDGLYGQFGVILRDLDATISLTGHYDGSTGDILRAVWTELVPALVPS